MKKIIALGLLINFVCVVSDANVPPHRILVANNMHATGSTSLQGAIITTLVLEGDLTVNDTTFGTINLNGTMITTDCTIATINVSNLIIGPSDEPVILVGSDVSGDVTFTGAYGKVILRNGSTIGGSVINGSVVIA